MQNKNELHRTKQNNFFSFCFHFSNKMEKKRRKKIQILVFHQLNINSNSIKIYKSKVN